MGSGKAIVLNRVSVMWWLNVKINLTIYQYEIINEVLTPRPLSLPLKIEGISYLLSFISSTATGIHLVSLTFSPVQWYFYYYSRFILKEVQELCSCFRFLSGVSKNLLFPSNYFQLSKNYSQMICFYPLNDLYLRHLNVLFAISTFDLLFLDFQWTSTLSFNIYLNFLLF